MDTEAGWIEVFASPARRACDERALVLMALDIPAVMLAVHGRFALLVSGADAQRAALELERYALENRPRPAALPPRLHAGAFGGAAVYALMLFLTAIASSRSLWHRDWYDVGVLDGARLRSGDWWRAITALTLHADLSHLAANVGFGVLFGTLAARVYGAGAGWLLILVASMLADAADGLWMPAGQVSLGASTAVFAALGALAVHRWPASTRLARAGLRGGSIVAACVLLAFLGTGDQHTDVVAHALGFLAGTTLALPLRRWPPASGRTQRLSAALALFLIVAGWGAALVVGAGRP